MAELIRAALPDTPLVVVSSVGTGASSAGLVGSSRERDHDIRLLGVQPFGSVSFGAEGSCDPEAIIAGIGSTIHNRRHHVGPRTLRRDPGRDGPGGFGGVPVCCKPRW
jgi:S-sulfo-L-cysteine synthase (3-phospho-L-serine-dependent)